MGNSICLDTDILVNFLRKEPLAVSWMEENRDKEIATTVVNIFELYYGAYASKLPQTKVRDVEKIIERVKVLNLSVESSKLAGNELARLKKEGQMVEFRDMLIASVALENNLPLKTNSIKHFERIKGLNLVD